MPNVEYTKPKILGVMKAPYAATAATKPVIKEDNNGLPNTCGIIRNVAPVAKPQHTKVNTDIAKKNGKLCMLTPTGINVVVTHKVIRLKSTCNKGTNKCNGCKWNFREFLAY